MKKNSKAKVLLEGKFLRFLNDGGYEYVQRNNCSGIVIIVGMTDDKKVVFTEQYRLPVGKNVVEFPAGLVNDHAAIPNESLLAGAKREFFEETGYKVRKMTRIVHGPVSGGSTSDLVSMFKAEGLKKMGDGGGDHTENIKVHEVPFNKVDRWLANMKKKGKLIEPKVYAGLYFLSKNKS